MFSTPTDIQPLGLGAALAETARQPALSPLAAIFSGIGSTAKTATDGLSTLLGAGSDRAQNIGHNFCDALNNIWQGLGGLLGRTGEFVGDSQADA